MIRRFTPSFGVRGEVARAGGAAAPVRAKPARRDKPEMTLDRVLSRGGIASRTAAARLIAAGRVSVGGRVVRDPLAWVTPAREAVELDGQPLRRPKFVYYALHKPVGTITSHGDPGGRRTIYDLPAVRALRPATEAARWLFSVGRLDLDTSGLLLLTNDSIFAERIAQPEAKVAKRYRVQIDAPVSAAALDRLRAGLDIGRGERSAAAVVRALSDAPQGCWIEIQIREGKNRQVRRMVEAVGRRVVTLVRVRVGKLALGNLATGAVRPIRPGDVVG